MPKYTRTETVEAWQWNGENPHVKTRLGLKIAYDHPFLIVEGRKAMNPGEWIIKREDSKYKFISDAKFKAQGWEEAE